MEKEQLNEFSTGYGFSPQNQEYGSIASPVDAETVQGNDYFNMKTPEGLHRMNTFLNHFFKRTTMNPNYDISQLRARLNHFGLDFPFLAMQPVQPINRFKVGRTEVFGTTPTTDLSKGFDTGDDQPVYTLEIRVIKNDHGFKLEGQFMPYDEMEESTHMMKSKRNKRIQSIKEMIERKKAIEEDYEIRQINQATSGRGEKVKKNTKELNYRRRTR